MIGVLFVIVADGNNRPGTVCSPGVPCEAQSQSWPPDCWPRQLTGESHWLEPYRVCLMWTHFHAPLSKEFWSKFAWIHTSLKLFEHSECWNIWHEISYRIFSQMAVNIRWSMKLEMYNAHRMIDLFVSVLVIQGRASCFRSRSSSPHSPTWPEVWQWYPDSYKDSHLILWSDLISKNSWQPSNSIKYVLCRYERKWSGICELTFLR